MGLAFFPTSVFFSTGTGFDPYLTTFSLLSVLATCRYAQKSTLAHGLLLGASLLLLVCVRVEAFAFLPVLAAVFISLKKKLPSSLTKMDWSVFVSIATLLLFRVTISLSIFGKPWCCAEALPLEAFHISYVIRHIFPNILTYFIRPEVPFLFSFLACISLARQSLKKTLIPLLWMGIFFFLYSSYYAGQLFDYQFSGSYGRFFLMQIPPLCMLAGLTVSNIFTTHSQTISKKTLLALSVFALLALFPTVKKYHTMITVSPYDKLVEAGPRVLHTFLDSTFIGKTHPEDIIIHNLTAPLLLSGRTTLYSGFWYDKKETQDFVEQALKEGKRVYYDQTRRCELFPDSCRALFTKFTFTPVVQQVIDGIPLQMDEVTLKPEP
jgi:hypothetical protein